MMNRRAYRDQVLARLRSSPFSAADVFDTSFTAEYNARPSRYLLVFTNVEAAESDRLAGPQADHDLRFVVRAVGKSPQEAMFAADHAMNRLINVRLEVAGRSSRPVRHVSSDPVQKDSSVGAGLYFYDDEYAWFSTPA